MARVDFYILPEGSPVERFACSVVARALGTGKRVHIHTGDESSVEMMDDLLWTFRDISFVPHKRYDGSVDEDTPVTIGCGVDYPENAEVMVNLARVIPEFSACFERIVEIVGGSEANKTLARQRYRDYRQGPYQVHDHKIEKTE